MSLINRSRNVALNKLPPNKKIHLPLGRPYHFDKDIMAWFMADEGTNWLDLSGRGHVGIASGSFVTHDGRYGPARYFDNVDDDYTISDHTDFNLVSEASISVWFKVNSLSTGWGTVLSKYSAAGDQKSYIMQTLNTACLFYYSFDGRAIDSISTGANITLGWHNVIARAKNGTAVQIYLDGTLKQTKAFAGDFFNSTADFEIGNYSGAEPFDGIIDEIIIWKRYLPTWEISNLYEYGKKRW